MPCRAGRAKPCRLCTKPRQTDHRYLAEILPTLTDQQQLTFLRKNQEREYVLALSLVRRFPESAEVRQRAAEWLLNGKAIAQQALAQATLAARDVSETRGDQRVQELLAVRAAWRTVAMRGRPRADETVADMLQRLPGDPPAWKEYDRLAERERALVQAIGVAGISFARPRPWIDLPALRKNLAKDAVFVDLVCLRVYDFETDKQTDARYLAWLVTAQDEPRLLDLGPAEPIDAAVKEVRKQFAAAPKAIHGQGEPDAETALRPVLDRLAKCTLHPLLGVIGKYPRWTISPDASLWLVPWAALPLPDGPYAVEKHTINFVVSGRDLVDPPSTAPAKRDEPPLVADPDFDLDPREGATLAAKLLGRPAPPADALALAPQAPGDVLRRVPSWAGPPAWKAPAAKPPPSRRNSRPTPVPPGFIGRKTPWKPWSRRFTAPRSSSSARMAFSSKTRKPNRPRARNNVPFSAPCPTTRCCAAACSWPAPTAAPTPGPVRMTAC